MKDPKVLNMTIEEFDKLAKNQSKLYPDLLLFREEEDIIDDFYKYYGRKRLST